MIQTLFLKSISCHLAPNISPERHAVRIANSNALDEIPFSALNAGQILQPVHKVRMGEGAIPALGCLRLAQDYLSIQQDCHPQNIP